MSIANARMSARPAAVETSIAAFAEDVAYYFTLTPRQLPSRYLYDPLGSALFDAICRLPWYQISQAEVRLLARHAREVFKRVAPLARVVELGPGNGDKLAALIESGQRKSASLQVHLVDVSSTALAIAARAVSALDGIHAVMHPAPYEIGLDNVRQERQGSGQTLVLFLGSNIGNFDPPGAEELIRRVRSTLLPGDGFLLGTDLIKPEPDLLLAYDDPLGVTAAFNRNLLVRANRELGANFDLKAYAHRALWNAELARVEMHLVSARRQHVRIPQANLDVTIERGETFWTESSYKYEPVEVIAMLERCGFRNGAQWVDWDARFALTLVEVTE
jgi:L-histidine Nalpha-methyltransferase